MGEVQMKEYVDRIFEENQLARDKSEGAILTMIRQLQDDVRNLRTEAAEGRGKASQNAMIVSIVIAFSGLILGLINLLCKIN